MHRRRRLTRRDAIWAGLCALLLIVGGGVAWAASAPGSYNCVKTDRSGGFSLNCAVATPTTSVRPSVSPSTTQTPPPPPSPTVQPSPTVSPTATPSTTTPPASTSPSPTGPGGGCLNQLAECGYPNAANTGPFADSILTAMPGDQSITTAGAVVENATITGCVEVNAPDVTIRNARVLANGCFWGIRNNSTNLTVENVELTCGGGNGTGIGWQNLYVVRSNIHNCENGFDVSGNGHVTVRDSWIHDMTTTGGAHADGLQFGAGAEFVLVDHNTITVAAPGGNAAIIMYNDDLAQNGQVLVSNNLLSGGTYTLYCPRQDTVGIRVVGNRFGPFEYGSSDSCVTGHVAEWSGNVRDIDGGMLAAA